MEICHPAVIPAEISSNTMRQYPVTPAIRFLRGQHIPYQVHLYPYIEHGGSTHCAACLGIEEHQVIKTLVFQSSDGQGVIALMYGDREVSAKGLARLHGSKAVEPVTPQQAQKWTGYMVGGISPFGSKTIWPIYAPRSMLDMPSIVINGGRRGMVLAIAPQALQQLSTHWVDDALITAG